MQYSLPIQLILYDFNFFNLHSYQRFKILRNLLKIERKLNLQLKMFLSKFDMLILDCDQKLIGVTYQIQSF